MLKTMTMIRSLLAAALLAAAAPAGALTHTVVPGDHLWGLAGHYYQNHFRWKVIYAANRDKIKDPHWIYPGQVLEIPETPGAEIGELPARPVEKEPQAKAPAEEPAQAGPVVVEPAPEKPAPPPAKTDDLSSKMPEGLAAQYPSVSRLKEPKDWKADGSITEFDGKEALAAEGDWVFGKAADASAGQRYTVYRRAGPQELDEDQKATYLQVIGRVEAKADMGKSRWRFLVLKSGDSVQVGDLLKKEGAR